MDGKEKDYISVGNASVLSGLDSQTIRKLVDTKKISGYKTPSGQRKINRKDFQTMLDNMLSDEKKQDSKKQNFLYTRVSTKKQLGDLSRQLEYVRRPEYSNYTVIQDVGSGINFKRKGISTILDSCVQGTIGEIIIAHRDRLSRFGFDLINLFVEKAGGKITVLDNDKITTSEIELAEDLLSIVHIYSCRQMGKRSYSNKRRKDVENYEDKDLSDKNSEEVD
jgi:predicted site-specific integrase-resolvase